MPLDVSRIQAICFDIDGTLSDTDDQWVSQVEKRLKLLRPFFPHQDVRPFARWLVMGLESPGNFMFWLLDWLHLDEKLDSFYNFIVKRRPSYRSPAFWLIPQTKEMLVILKQRYLLAIVSGRGEESTQAFLDQYELRPLFSAVATAYTCEYCKPYPHSVLWVAQQLGIPPTNCLMVGDTTVDIRAGKAAGAQTAGVLSGFGHARDLRRAGADLILPSAADLLEVLGLNPHRKSQEADQQEVHEVLHLLYNRINGTGILWAVTGSLGMQLQGLLLEVHDIDIQTDQAGAYQVESLFSEYMVEKVAFSSAKNIRSHFGTLKIGGVKVEIMGNIEKCLPDGTWEGLDLIKQRKFVTLEEMDIPVLSLEYEYQAYQRLGRLERAQQIRDFLDKK
ncbi:MAG: HAD-IA family hydrolase [Planctomycetes bacterium]|nr:HAD-IA family hydrolase [Planctomycetota bacterium]